MGLSDWLGEKMSIIGHINFVRTATCASCSTCQAQLTVMTDAQLVAHYWRCYFKDWRSWG